MKHEYDESQNRDYQHAYYQTAYNSEGAGAGAGLFYSPDTVGYSGFISTVSDLHEPGENGGLFIREDYNPHINSLTPMELENLREMYEQTEGVHKKVLLQIIRKYGPDKLKL